MKRFLFLIFIVLIFISFTSDHSFLGSYKSSKTKSIKQQVIEIFPNGTFVYSQVINLGPDSALSWSGDIVLIRYGYWEKKGNFLIVRNAGVPDSTNENEFKRDYEVAAYFKSVCPECPGFAFYDTGRDTLNRMIYDTIFIKNKNELVYRNERYRK